MYKIIVIDEDGNERVTENVLDYNYIDVDLCQNIAIDHATELTDEELKEVERRCENSEQLPDMDSLRWIIKEIIDERE